MQASASDDGDASSVDDQSSDYYSSRDSTDRSAHSSEDSDNSRSRYDSVEHWIIRRLSTQSSSWSFPASDDGSDGSTTTTTPEVFLTRPWTAPFSKKEKRGTRPSFKWTCIALAVGFVSGWLANGTGLLPSPSSSSSSSSSPSAAATITAAAAAADASKGGRLSRLLPSKPIDFSPEDFAWIKPDPLAVFGVEKPPPHKGWPAVEQCKKDVRSRARSLKAVWHPEKTRNVRRNADIMLAPWQLDVIFNKICHLEAMSMDMCGGAGGGDDDDGASTVNIDAIVGRGKAYAHGLRENKADYVAAADIEAMDQQFAKFLQKQEMEKERERNGGGGEGK